MSKRYSPDFKRLVLKLLRANQNNVPRVATFANVPQRTLRDWQKNERERAARRRTAAVQTNTVAKRQSPPS